MVLSLVCSSSNVFAQQRTISGTIKDTEGIVMPGVNVIVKGTSIGSTSDSDGKYSISVPQDASVLTFSFIGFTSQEIEIGNRTTIDVSLVADITELNEVVVTALGVERDTKALQYSVSKVGGENLTKARVNNVGNALSGRVAGVNVSNIATGPAGSSRVLIRGNKSLNGQNQPLYVVDGMPMDNSQFGDNNGQAGQWSGQDQGNGLSSINPDDIESITVLKGAAATALYGARGGNGVINIVTKKGARGKQDVNVSVASNLVFEKVNNLSDLQTTYGSGNYVNGVPTAPQTLADITNNNWLENSWGPKLGTGTFLGQDGVEREYVYAGDNWDRFYNTGKSWTNSLSITGGGENIGLRFSASDLKSDGIIPNSGFDRSNLALAANAKLKKFSVDAKIMYSHENAKNRPTVSDSPGNAVQAVWRLPPNININNLKGDPNNLGAIPADVDPALLSVYRRTPGQELLPSATNNWGPNPWWVAYQHTYSDVKDRTIASGKLRYDITDFLYATGGLSIDRYARKNTRIYPIGTGDILSGNMEEGTFNVQEVNMDWMLGFDKTFNKLSVNAFVGGNRMRRYNERIRATVTGFNGGFEEFINNGSGRNFGYEFNQSGINSLFGSSEFGYNNILFLTATVRQDWFSVLNDEFENGVLYPSVGATFVFSDAFQMPAWYSFGKLRASYGEVGVVTINPYSVRNTYSFDANPQLGRAFGSFTRAMGRYGTISNPELVPAKSKELEIGIDTRLFNNRVGVDLTYYSQTTVDDIVALTFPLSSGFQSREFNVGKLTNKGIEIMLSGTPLQTGDLRWDISVNYAKNINRVVDLIEGVQFIQGDNSRTQTTQIRHVEGGYYGEIWGVKQRMVDGQPVFRPNGSVRGEDATGYQYLGNSVADGRGGIDNSFTYKGINLSFLIDIQVGGELHSGTNDRLTGWGLHKQSLAGREGESSVVHITGLVDVNNNGTAYEPVDRDLTPDQARQYWTSLGGAASDRFVYDAGFGKLRQVTLGYSLPRSILSNTPFENVTFSIVARNLAILWKHVDNIDPESVYSSNGNSQGLDYFGMPTTRSVGFDLKVDF